MITRIVTPLLIAVRAVLSVSLGGIFFMSGAAAAEGAKTYTLFEGNNIAVGQGKDVYPVRDVNGGSWVIVVDGKEVLVSAKSGPISMKVTPVTKLSDISVTLVNLKTERAYTYQNDPAVRLTRSLNQAATTNAGYQAAVSQAAAAQDTGLMLPSGNTATNSGNSGSSTVNTGPTDRAMQSATNGPGGDLAHATANAAEGDFDALDVSFEISAPTPLSAPYIVTTTRIHEPGSPVGSFRNVVFAKALEPVNSNVTKNQFQQAGFPFGYLLEGYEIHVYDNGREVATNLSPKRQVLTLDQAFEYVRRKYIESHRTGTFPPIPVMGDLPRELPAQVANGKYATPVYVRVSEEGLAQDAFADAGCKTKIDDPFLETVIRAIRFEPALDAGKPVDGVVALNISKLRM